MRRPKTPVDIHDLNQAAALCAKWPGVFRARHVRLVNGIAMKDVIAVSFWPWVIRRQRLIQTIAADTSSRFALANPPPLVLMRSRRARKIQKAYDKAQQTKEKFYDAE